MNGLMCLVVMLVFNELSGVESVLQTTTKKFIKWENHLLIQNIIDDTNAETLLRCTARCFHFPCCHSVNYDGGAQRCLLSNDTGLGGTSGRVDITTGWTLLIPEQPIDQCIDTPCQNGAKCSTVCLDGTDTFTCDCVAGTMGQRCHITDGCNVAIGMESTKIPDALISASSFEDIDHAAHKARLHLPAVSWTAESTDTSPWLKVELLKLTDVTGVVLQGSGQTNQGWVTKFKLSYIDESDGETEGYKDSSGEEKMFVGNSDVSDEQKYFLYPIIHTRSLTFRILEWNEKCSARVEIYGCSQEEWVLAFKGRAETGVGIYDAWVSSSADSSTQVWADRTFQSSHHYRNDAVFHNWTQLQITEVKFSLFAVNPTVEELLSMRFQGAESDPSSWFKTSSILESPWTDLHAGSTVYIGSMAGDPVLIGYRHFQFESCSYSGCSNDCGWLMVSTCGSPCTCAQEAQLSGRHIGSKIIYCKKTTSCLWIPEFSEVGFADALTIHVKF